MRVVQMTSPGDPSVLELVEVATPDPGTAELLVDVHAAGVNYIDTYHRSGLYDVPMPFRLGLEGAGTVRAVGKGVVGFAVGDRVAWLNAYGSYADQVIVAAGDAIAVPDGVDDDTAAALLLQGVTAHYLAVSVYPIQEGDWVLVHAAAGGVGLLLTQIVKILGGNVIATVSSEPKARLAEAAGADHVTSYEEFAIDAHRITNGEGVAAVYDGVGAATFGKGLDALRVRGTMALYGAASGPVRPFDPQLLNRKGALFVTRPSLAFYTRTRQELTGRADALLDWVDGGQLTVTIGSRFGLHTASQAHESLERRKTTGKVLLLPDRRGVLDASR